MEIESDLGSSKMGSARVVLELINHQALARNDQAQKDNEPPTPLFASQVYKGTRLPKTKAPKDESKQSDVYRVDKTPENPRKQLSIEPVLDYSGVPNETNDQKNQKHRLSFRNTNTSYSVADYQNAFQHHQGGGHSLSPQLERENILADEITELQSIVHLLLQVKSRIEALASYGPGTPVREEINSLVNLLQRDLSVRITQEANICNQLSFDDLRFAQLAERSPSMSRDSGLFRLSSHNMNLPAASYRLASPTQTRALDMALVKEHDMHHLNRTQSKDLETTTAPGTAGIREIYDIQGSLDTLSLRPLFNYSMDRYVLTDINTLSSY